jgi:hypothetical protein
LRAVVPACRVVPALCTLCHIESVSHTVVAVIPHVALAATVPRFEPQLRAVVTAPRFIPATSSSRRLDPAPSVVIPVVPPCCCLGFALCAPLMCSQFQLFTKSVPCPRDYKLVPHVRAPDPSPFVAPVVPSITHSHPTLQPSLYLSCSTHICAVAITHANWFHRGAVQFTSV